MVDNEVQSSQVELDKQMEADRQKMLIELAQEDDVKGTLTGVTQNNRKFSLDAARLDGVQCPESEEEGERDNVNSKYQHEDDDVISSDKDEEPADYAMRIGKVQVIEKVFKEYQYISNLGLGTESMT